jgi:prolyl-tRNA synthetase
MRYSRMFVRTQRDAPAGADTASAALLTRAGFIRQLGAGIYTMQPLGWRSALRIESILREEMAAIGCEELLMPFAQPADLWQETGRFEGVGPEMVRFQDRAGRPMVLAATHEEVATDLVRREVRSYRQLPLAFFQIQSKFRDEPRPRAGLLRAREFLMKDAYSFHATRADFERFYNDCYRAYLRIFTRCGAPVTVVEASGGYMGSEQSHEFMLEAAAGEDVLLICPNGDYAANREIAAPVIEMTEAEPLPLDEVATPGAATIDAVADYLSVDRSRTLKAVFYESGGRLVFVAIRGDFEVNATKLSTLLGVDDLRPASAELIEASGATPGYASPVSLRNVMVVADVSARTPNLVAGANRVGFHLRNVNLDRDYQPELVAEIAAVTAGMPCPVCGAPLEERRGIEVGNIFPLGTRYAAPLRATYLDEHDQEQLIIMGSYGIGVGRLLAAIAEHAHDERGLIWPISIAPFDVHLVLLGREDEARVAANELYAALEANGIESLYDDREESAGVKFNDADLLGIPLRVTIGARSLAAGGVELKGRAQGPEGAEILPLESAVEALTERVMSLRRALLDAAAAAECRTPA